MMMKVKVSIFSALFSAHWALVLGIQLNVTVPQYGVLYGSQTLRCNFQLDNHETLYALKWYFGEHEFYRVTPQTSSSGLIFPVEGITVDAANSNINQVVLKDINLKSSGTFKCQTTVDRPTFRTLSKEGYMIVIAPPLSHPEITGFHPVISVGDPLHANCSQRNSKPAASLMFYINEEKAEAGDMIEYLPIYEPDGLETSMLGLNIHTEARHFRNGILEIKCTATIGNVYGVGRRFISEASINAQPSVPGRNRHLSSDSASSKDQFTTFGFNLLLVVFLVRCLKFMH